MNTAKTFIHSLVLLLGLLSLTAQAGVEITYIHNDALGSSVAGTDEQGDVKWRSNYQPYGEERLGERSLFGVRSGYTGHREDVDSGLVYMGARYYSPELGRFMAVDPVGVSADNVHSFNRYAYANNNPYKYLDPDGKAAILPILMWGGGVAAFVGDLFFPEPAQLDEHGDAPLQDVWTLPGPLGKFKKASIAEDAGDLTKQEIKQIQDVVNEAGRPLEVVGSAAKGKRRGVGSNLPVGKGDGTKSDIDVLIPPSSMDHFKGLTGKLPDADVNIGTANPNIGPSIRFEPK